MKTIAVVITTYNRISLLKDLIKSIREQTVQDFQIIVVNNASNDGTEKWLKTQSDVITITQENCGGAGGFFTGMKYAAENGYQYCWLMDDDVFCYTTALEELMKITDLNGIDFGYVCSKVIGIDNEPMNVPTVDTRPSVSGYPNWLAEIEHDLIRVLSATFVSILIPMKNITELGLPYKEFIIWGDDIEYTTRISKKKISFLAFNSVVVHRREQQYYLEFEKERDPARLKKYFYMFRNELFTVFKHGTVLQRIKHIFMYIFRFLKILLRFDFRRLYILIKSLFASFVFFPKIYYPKKMSTGTI
ncbi:glycosyl transferase [Spirochaetia bacterium]|nr:glycosyl transferase [Spirochaetia bacterium]